MNTITQSNEFLKRHIGPQESDLAEMFTAVGIDSLDLLIDETVPQSILNSASP
jgi:glycine dehydrogenase